MCSASAKAATVINASLLSIAAIASSQHRQRLSAHGHDLARESARTPGSPVRPSSASVDRQLAPGPVASKPRIQNSRAVDEPFAFMKASSPNGVNCAPR